MGEKTLGKQMTNLAHLKILIALQKSEKTDMLQRELECLGHRVCVAAELDDAVRCLQDWQPDLVVGEEGLGRRQPDAGLLLAEYCRTCEDHVSGWPGTRTVILVPTADWDCFKRVQRTGAHVIVSTNNFDALIRYIQTVSDNLATDRVLGPALVGIHRYNGKSPSLRCENCEWVGAEISYLSSRTDVRHLTPVRIAVFNALLFRSRGQSPNAIVSVCNESLFLQQILQNHPLKKSGIKMEITRLRQHLQEALETIGAPYTGEHFLPFVRHGVNTYGLNGNRRLIHNSCLLCPAT